MRIILLLFFLVQSLFSFDPEKPVFNKYGIADVFMEDGFYAINKKKKKLFKIFPFDNGPDYFEEGLRRYIKDGKIGFVDVKGKVIIPAQFEFVFPFRGGKAEFCEKCEFQKTGEHSLVLREKGIWGTINKKGIKTYTDSQK
jgi:hypothetical protein